MSIKDTRQNTIGPEYPIKNTKAPTTVSEYVDIPGIV